MILLYICVQIEIQCMEEAARFSGCTLSYHQCRCFDKLSFEQKEFLDAKNLKPLEKWQYQAHWRRLTINSSQKDVLLALGDPERVEN